MFSYVAAGFQVYRYVTISEKLDALTANEEMYPEFGKLANWQRLVRFQRLMNCSLHILVQFPCRLYRILCVAQVIQVHFIQHNNESTVGNIVTLGKRSRWLLYHVRYCLLGLRTAGISHFWRTGQRLQVGHHFQLP